ncbi:MAG: biopolymer transporter ExbD [Akkermansiaceae bacterium]|jgi:biopolymer transport protein ExbD|nr:biopolymer transporter ExbD [Akkermansiaceae bacterium]MDP4647380.1 biopolymer transporter ExbD [Akkermansiaceae bacterium]MDP4721606.1 biopolymer transporter ExbD [Akkermansiaceae bacterium]MDP4779532.1 biopolymer transporter ExbD [Akkermansiaceae bacterium]MDP4847350.1 biopolymer transporter ExbD [Akkermansiaceae bacterium]
MFGRNLSDESDEPVHVDLSSMIDCVFILLIFFIVSTVFVEETGVTVNKPDVGGASALEKNSILLAVTSEDKVFYGGESVGVQGVIGKIKPLLTETPDMSVIIQGDKDATHGLVQQVHGQAILAGAQKDRISVSTK